MKYAAYGLLAAFLASGVHGAIPDTASGWYTPSGGKFETKDSYGEVWYFDEDGGWTHSEVTVDENGKVTDWEGDIDILGAAYPAYQAMLSALKAETIAKQNTERIHLIGENLNNLRTSGISIENANTKQKFTVRFGSSIGSTEQSGPVPATSDAEDPADEVSLAWTDSLKLEINGWHTATPAAGITLWDALTNQTGYVNDPYRSWSVLSRAKDGTLKYMPFGHYDLKNAESTTVDGQSVVTNETDGAISLYGWESSDGVESLADFLTVDRESADADDLPTYEVLARCTDGEDTSLAYLSLGNLYGVTWATNWTEAVEHITKEETIKIVNWTTNWVNYTENITNYYDVVNWITNWVEHSLFVTNYEDVVNIVTNMVYHENFITNMFYHENFITNTWNHENFVTNMFYHENFITNVINHEDFVTNVIEVYSSITNFENFVTFQTNTFENLRTIENWTYITNYIVRYLGGGGSGDGGEDYGPAIEPEDDPYSPAYEPQEIDEDLLPVKNARMLVAITNSPFSKLDAHKMLDFRSVDTNGSSRAQVFGFAQASENAIPIKKRKDGEPVLEWVDFPTNLVSITTNEIEEIRKWMRYNDVKNIFNTTVTNAEKFAEMRTNFFSQVVADTLLDGESVWTNGNRRVEVKGYRNAAANTYPVKTVNAETGAQDITWNIVAQPDSEVIKDIIVGDIAIYNRSLERQDGYGLGTDNVWSIYGFGDASDGQVPVKQTKNGYETLAWTNLQAEVSADGLSITNVEGVLSLNGYAAAEDNAVPMKTAQGLSWLKASSATNLILAGAGINITDNGGGAITISAQSLDGEDSGSGASQTVTVVTDVRYDEASHKFQKKTRQLVFKGSLGTESGWTDVFYAVPHSDEHTEE